MDSFLPFRAMTANLFRCPDTKKVAYLATFFFIQSTINRGRDHHPVLLQAEALQWSSRHHHNQPE